MSEVERIDRLYAALRQVSRAAVRERSREALFGAVCRALVERGGLGAAAIEARDLQGTRFVPVASAGAYPPPSEPPEAQTPAERAVASGQPYVCDELGETTARNALASCASFAIDAPNAPLALTVFAAEPGYFSARALALLAGAAEDTGFALENLAVEAARAQSDERNRRDAAAAESERLFATGLVEAMPGIFYLYDQRGRFLRWNRNFERVSGYSPEEISAIHPLDLFTGDDKALLERRIAEVFERGEASVEASFVSKDGRSTPYFFTGKRVTLEGAPHLMGVGVDISERTLAEAALKKTEERYRTTLDTIFEAGQLLDFDWRYLYLNPSAALQNRRPNAELLGRTMPEAWPGIEATPVFASLRRCLEERVSTHIETEFHFADGTSGWFDVRAQPVPEGIFVVSVDITERRQAERALRELNESLERKVAERTVALDAARERAESADRIKSAFLATMSHELRTPLNSILGFTGIVLKGMAGPLVPEQVKQLGMVQTSARHLLDLINDVLDISKIEAGQLEIRRANFALRDAVERVVALVKPMAEKKSLRLRCEVPEPAPVMFSDRRRVEQILLNLLNNAIKFTDRGEVGVAVRLDEAQSTVHIAVSDTGIGMKQEDLPTLFQPFRQIDSGLQRQHEGTGLGLAICRRLTTLLGGTIRAESVWGEGSVITVSLPVRQTEVP